MATRYVKNGKELRLTIATRHPLIDQVKASPHHCIVEEAKGKLYVCYNTPFQAEKEGVEVTRDF